MGRPTRNFVPGDYYLVSHTGNKNLAVYLDSADNEHSLRLLRIGAARYRVAVLAYSQNGTQGMWIFRPSTRAGISQLIRDMQGGYSRYLNRKYKHRHWLAGDRRGPSRKQVSGRIERSVNWPGRFRCIRIPASLLQPATHLVEQTPVRLNQCEDAGNYEWSSASARLKGACVRKITQLIRLDIPPERWAAYLMIPAETGWLNNIEAALRRGTIRPSAEAPLRQLSDCSLSIEYPRSPLSG